MKILVIGGGGREHALVWSLAQSPGDHELFCAPGNAGTEGIARSVDIAATDVEKLVEFVEKHDIDLTVVGPEAPLCAGIVDVLQKKGRLAFGPGARGARLEGDKAWCKELMARHSIPTAAHRVFQDAESALAYVEDAVDFPMVVKASGLAAGKGVIICSNAEEAEQAIRDLMVDKRFGDAGDTLVIEDFLEGEEASVIALSDGETICVFESSQDHKRAFDGDKGPNTGGMGAYSPAPVVTADLQETIEREVLVPIVHALQYERIPFRGVLYAGLMITRKGPRVLEFNVRFGDPECQALLMRFRGDLADVLHRCARGDLAGAEMDWDRRPAITVVVAQEGYPGPVTSGTLIGGLENLRAMEDVEVFHAGTRSAPDGVVATGGRVLNVTALGDDLAAARKRVYEAVDKLDFPHSFHRRDIGHRAL